MQVPDGNGNGHDKPPVSAPPGTGGVAAAAPPNGNGNGNHKKRGAGRPFEKGKSGNPAGRPPGMLCRTTKLTQFGDEWKVPKDVAALYKRRLKINVEGLTFEAFLHKVAFAEYASGKDVLLSKLLDYRYLKLTHEAAGYVTPQQPGGASAGGTVVNLNQIEQLIAATEPKTDRPDFDEDH